MRTKQLPQDYALVLQQISDDGVDAVEDLAADLRLEPRRMWDIVRSLQHKGLVMIRRGAPAKEAYVMLSAKGRHLMQYLWPESHTSYGY